MGTSSNSKIFQHATTRRQVNGFCSQAKVLPAREYISRLNPIDPWMFVQVCSSGIFMISHQSVPWFWRTKKLHHLGFLRCQGEKGKIKSSYERKKCVNMWNKFMGTRRIVVDPVHLQLRHRYWTHLVISGQEKTRQAQQKNGGAPSRDICWFLKRNRVVTMYITSHTSTYMYNTYIYINTYIHTINNYWSQKPIQLAAACITLQMMSEHSEGTQSSMVLYLFPNSHLHFFWICPVFPCNVVRSYACKWVLQLAPQLVH